MVKKEVKNSIIEFCPIRNVVARFGNKWALLVILILNENGPVRFNQLAKMIPDISAKVLADTLHTLDADGLVNRSVYAQVPIRVDYELTDIGKTLVPIILELTDWAQNNMKPILSHRKKHQEQTA